MSTVVFILLYTCTNTKHFAFFIVGLLKERKYNNSHRDMKFNKICSCTYNLFQKGFTIEYYAKSWLLQINMQCLNMQVDYFID